MKKFIQLLGCILIFVMLSGCLQSTDNISATDTPQTESKTDDETLISEETETETVNVAEYGYGYANIKLELLDGWSYRIVEKDETKEGYEDTFGIDFYPDEAPEHVYHFYYHAYPFGMCGTGVECEKIELKNGMSVVKYTEKYPKDEQNAGMETWLTIIFTDRQGDYVIQCNDSTDVMEKYDSQLFEILETVEIGSGAGNLSREEAIEIAKKAMDAPDEYLAARFEYQEGVFRVYSPKLEKTAKVDLNGNVTDIYEGDLYTF
ncbi:MAG: hypothetical protein ACI4AQ_01955 [Lachnospiraceae bacterium]